MSPRIGNLRGLLQNDMGAALLSQEIADGETRLPTANDDCVNLLSHS